MKKWIVVFFGYCICLQLAGDVFGAAESKASFMATKTIFQTDRPYDPRMGVSADGVIVHRHGVPFEDLNSAIGSWSARGGSVGRMFFVDSDGANTYWNGTWDGTDHSDDIERKADGEKLLCAGVRPYMVPTAGWTRYLAEQTEVALRAGATAIFPEEPLGHAYTGYSPSFQTLWEQHYGFSWQAQEHSALARFLTAQLKAKQYLELEKALLETTRAYGKKTGTEASFIIPIHSIYGNIAGQLVAPLGASTELDEVDGYIGQIWTGPVNWSLGQYDSPSKSFFGSAYALYDYFTQLTVDTDKKLWLLVDPVEDDPNHTWNEFSQWYHHCVAAMLLMPEVDSYEIMPWPDRIFLPGFDMGGGTPAPPDFRMTLLAITQALQEMPLGGEWALMESAPPSTGISVAMADSAMWLPGEENKLQGIYGQLMPLIERGVPVGACVLERAGDPVYMDRHKVIVLSYENFKPITEAMNTDLAKWVKRGGGLVLLGNSNDALDQSEYFWWHKLGFASPMHHLIAQLGDRPTGTSEWNYGKGYVIRNRISSKDLAQPSIAEAVYLPMIDQALLHTESAEELHTPGYFMMRRGPFVIAHAMSRPISLTGTFVDIFDPALPVIDEIELAPGGSGLFRDVSAVLDSEVPQVLHATHRLMSQQTEPEGIRFWVKGPAETPAVVRLFPAGREILEMTATSSSGKKIEIASTGEGSTIQLRFQNDPDGIHVALKMKQP